MIEKVYRKNLAQRFNGTVSAQAKFPLMLSKLEGGTDPLLLTASTDSRNNCMTGPLYNTFHPTKSPAAFWIIPIYR